MRLLPAPNPEAMGSDGVKPLAQARSGATMAPPQVRQIAQEERQHEQRAYFKKT
jgi:hypothetical protein